MSRCRRWPPRSLRRCRCRNWSRRSAEPAGRRWCASRGSRRGVVRVAAEPAKRAVVAGHRRWAAGNPVGQLRHDRLGDDHRSRLAQQPRHGGLVRRHIAFKRQRPTRRGHIGGVDVVLERDRHAVERAPYSAGLALAVERLGLFECVRVHRQHGVEPLLVRCDAGQRLLNQLARSHAPVGHRPLHFGDRGFDDGEGWRLSGESGGGEEKSGNATTHARCYVRTSCSAGL